MRVETEKWLKDEVGLFPYGCVRIKGLKNTPQLNGAYATCSRWDYATEKMVVRLLDGGEEKSVSYENITPLLGIWPGGHVEIAGLKRSAQFNGSVAVCVR